jgi:Glycosyl transferase family 11/Lanthionine synthetase C-like protein
MEVISFIHLGQLGQCGNQLFEIASVIGLCDRYGAKPAFPVNWKYRNDFNVPDEYFRDVEPDYFLSGHQPCYNPDLLEKVKHYKVVDITEYLQSEKYFFNVIEKIKTYLTPKGTLYLGDNSVGIHIRRGDYIGHPYFYQLEPAYYLSAIRQYFSGSHYNFFICSDDPDYCRLNFKEEKFIIEQRSEIDDLRILAGCNQHIIADSTFSWWGAYLSHSSLVLRPPKIFAGWYSRIRKETDFWPGEWVINDCLKMEFINSVTNHSTNSKVINYNKLKLLKEIVNHLFLFSGTVADTGLMHGKMGICIFLYHFSQKTENKNYEDFAGELLDDVFKEINSRTSFDFENGLAGIGWGIEYLVKNGFVEGDTDEVLAEIDQKLLEILSSSSHLTLNLLSGILGIGIYFLSRIKKAETNIYESPFITNERLIFQLINELENRIEKHKKDHRFYNGGTLMFDLSWDYPVILCLLAEIYEMNILKDKVSSIIFRLLDPLRKEDNLPKLNVNRALLIIVMVKLKNCQINLSTNENLLVKAGEYGQNINDLNALLRTITENLLSGIDSSVLNNELSSFDTNIAKCKFGVTWLYNNKMFNLPDPNYENGPVLWKTITQKIINHISRSDWFDHQNKDMNNSIGLLDGLAGVGLQLLSPE